VRLERGPLRLVRIIEGRLGVYKIEINVREDTLRWTRDTLYPQKLALTSPASGGRSIGIVRLRTKATDFSFIRQVILSKICCKNMGSVRHIYEVTDIWCLTVTWVLRLYIRTSFATPDLSWKTNMRDG
jgi:hypothetical protein